MERLRDVELFLLDMDGTIYLGERVFDVTPGFLDAVKGAGKRVMYLTNNSSQNRFDYAEKLRRLGIEATPDDVFTSGEATVNVLKGRYESLFVAGTPSLEKEFRDAGFSVNEGNFEAAVLGFDKTLTYEKLVTLCDLVRDGKPFIATHPDYNCPVEGGFIPDTGSMLALVKASAGRNPDLVVGKPNAKIVEAACAKAGVKKERCAMVGDRLYTDIAAGVNAGVLSILVLSGESRAEDIKDIVPDFVFNDIGEITAYLK